MPKKFTSILVAVLIIIAIASYIFYQNFLIAAKVNGTPISRLEVIAELEKQGGKKVLDSMITQELILGAAKKANISVSQDEIDKELKKIEANVAAQGTTLDEALKKQGMTRDQLEKEIRIQVMVQKLVKADDIKITDQEVEKYLADNKDQFPADSKDKPTNDQIKETLKQQKQQTKIQEFIANLRTDAKIDYFGSYK